MEQLISFVTHNFFVVIIVVGLIYQLFFRKSPLERQRNRMPDFGGDGQHHPPRLTTAARGTDAYAPCEAGTDAIAAAAHCCCGGL